MKKLLSLIMVCVMLLNAYGCQNNNVTPEMSLEESTEHVNEIILVNEDMNEARNQHAINNTVKVAYVPLDNRPVNYDRVIYLAESAGIDLIMPEEDLFRTAMDNMEPNENGTRYGDRSTLLNWLMTADEECDYFVISLDQLLSGGLVASRWMTNTDLSIEYETIDYIIELSKNNTVVIFDTVMRLASNIGFNGYTEHEYMTTLDFAGKEREILTEENLTVENIIEDYVYDANGRRISEFDNPVVQDYLRARERKLRITDYFLSKDISNIDHVIFGVDDSSPYTTIQTNEINYIHMLMGDNCSIYAGADEFGLMGIARIASKIHGNVSVNVVYYGYGENEMADCWDISTLSEAVESHLYSLGCEIEETDAEIRVLVYTSLTEKDDAKKLIDDAIRYIQNEIPVIIIDPNNGENCSLQDEMIEREFPVSMLMGYSNWNTAANSIGIALANGVARYTYLKNCENISYDSHISFVKANTFAMLKDVSYVAYECGFENMEDDVFGGYTQVLRLINESPVIVSINPYCEEYHNEVNVSNFRYPWNRSCEMTFDISVE